MSRRPRHRFGPRPAPPAGSNPSVRADRIRSMAPQQTPLPEPTDKNGTPRYWECLPCGYLSNDPRVGSGEVPCPVCGTADTGERRAFPPERQKRLDARIRAYHADGDFEIVVILVATFLETLLEDILSRIMESQGATSRLVETVLDSTRSIGSRLSKIFPTLTGAQFDDVVAESGFREFPRRWRRLRAERNAFIHDSAFEGPKEEITRASAVEAMELLGQAYKVFVHINNRFVVDGPRRKRR